MKVGEKVPFNIGGHAAGEAEIKAVDATEGTVTLIVPSTLVVMGYRTELTEGPTSTGGGTQVIIDEVVREPSATAGETTSAETTAVPAPTPSEPTPDAGAQATPDATQPPVTDQSIVADTVEPQTNNGA